MPRLPPVTSAILGVEAALFSVGISRAPGFVGHDALAVRTDECRGAVAWKLAPDQTPTPHEEFADANDYEQDRNRRCIHSRH
jgi:hypothetical protein